MPEGIGSLVNLRELNCDLCSSLVSIPESKIVYFLTLDLVFPLNHLRTILTHVYFGTISEGFGVSESKQINHFLFTTLHFLIENVELILIIPCPFTSNLIENTFVAHSELLKY